MARYVAWRLLLIVPSLLFASLVVFVIMRALPGDVAVVILSGSGEAVHSVEAREALREELGLNDPLPVQYSRWLWSMASGEFGGRSLVSREPIGSLVVRQLPVTLLLALYATVVAAAVALPAGVFAALRRGQWPDFTLRVLTLLGQAVPNFWVALLAVLGLVLVFRWSPPIVYASPLEDLAGHFQIMALPALVLAWEYSSHIARVTRSGLLDTLQQDYIRTARGKGLPERVVVARHALRNALVPSVTVMGLQLGALLGGTLILESIFGLPGLGRALVQAALARDYPVVQSLAILLIALTLLVSLVVDLIYAALDPRISYRA